MSAILKTYIHNIGGCSNLQRYLEKDREGKNRTLAFDFSSRINDPKNWAHEFDLDRKNFRKDFGRKCYHFVISPDPTDNANLEQVRELAKSWVNENFSNSKYAIYYHDDNNDGILHAHICVNSVQLDGYKIHIDRKKYDDIRLETHRIAKKLGMKTPAPKSERDLFLSNINNSKEQKNEIKYNPKTACEKRIEKRGFKTWKQQLRDLIDINKTYATSWDDFVRKMNNDGVEVRQTFNKKTKQLGYTYHFKEPVFNKKTGKEFHFACKDKNLSDDINHPNKYRREKIIESFDYNGTNTLSLQSINKQKNLIKNETLIYFGWLPLVYPKPHRKQTGTLVKHNHKLPRTIKYPEIKSYHGRLTYATINNSLANISAMTEAVKIIKQQNIKSKQDLTNLYARDHYKIENLKAKKAKWEELYDEASIVNTHVNNYLAFNDEEELQWLKDHNYKHNSNELSEHREVLKSLKDGIEKINNQIETIKEVQQEREKAFNIIKNNLEPKHRIPRSSRTTENKNKTATVHYLPCNSSKQYIKNQEEEAINAEIINLQNEQQKRQSLQSSERMRLTFEEINKKINTSKEPKKEQKTPNQETMNFIAYAKEHSDEFNEENYSTEIKEEPKTQNSAVETNEFSKLSVANNSQIKNQDGKNNELKIKPPDQLKADAMKKAAELNADGYRIVDGRIQKR